MADVKHTPAPWKPAKSARINDVGGLYEIHWSDDGECVAEIVHGEANANLIAAAPELLEALEAVKARGLPDRYASDAELADQIDAAIAKARGDAS